MDLIYTVQIKVNDLPEFKSDQEASEHFIKSIKRQFPQCHIMGMQNVTLQKVLDVTNTSTDLTRINTDL